MTGNPRDFHRSWCCVMQWPDKDGKTFKPFRFGTVFADTAREAEALLLERWADICPHTVKLINVIPGMIVFCPREER